MAASLCIMIILSILVTTYSVFLKLQFKNMNKQLEKRFSENTRQPVTLELLDKDLNNLAVNINRCLKAEEQLRLKTICEEKLLREMIANISHDLRTPLTAIKGYQQLMLNNPLSDEQRTRLETAQNHADNLEVLISQFFQYSYLINTDLNPSMEEINLSNLLVQCLADSVSLVEQSGLSLIIEDFPSYIIMGDKEFTIRIIHNLLRNCVTHASGDIVINITSGEYIRLTFKNPVAEGDKIDITRLFERFYTSDKARSKSTGLGLSIVKMLAESMDGHVGASLENDSFEIWIDFKKA